MIWHTILNKWLFHSVLYQQCQQNCSEAWVNSFLLVEIVHRIRIKLLQLRVQLRLWLRGNSSCENSNILFTYRNRDGKQQILSTRGN